MSKKKDTKRTEQIQNKAKKKLNQIKKDSQSSYSYRIHMDPKTGKPVISNYNNPNHLRFAQRDPRRELVQEAYQRVQQRINKTHKNYDIMYNPKRNQYKLVEANDVKTYKSAKAKADKNHDGLLFDFGYVFMILRQAMAHYDFYTYKHMALVIALNMQSHPVNLPKLSDNVANYTRAVYKSSPTRFENVLLDLNVKMQYEICKAHIQYVHNHQRHNMTSVYRTLNDVVTDYNAHNHPIWPHKLAEASSKSVRSKVNGLQVLDEIYHYVLDDKDSMQKAISQETVGLLGNQAKANKIQAKISKILYHLDDDITNKNTSASKEDFDKLENVMNRHPEFISNISTRIVFLHATFKKDDMDKEQDSQFKEFLYDETIKAMQSIYDDHDLFETNENLRSWIQNTHTFIYKHVFNKLNPRFALPARNIDEASKDLSRLIQYTQVHKESLIKSMKLNFYSNK